MELALFQGTLVTLWGVVIAHQTVSALIAAWLCSNVVSALPSPDQASGKFYKFLFSLFHGMAGSLPRLLPMLRMPSDASRGTQTFFGSQDSPKPPGI